MRYVVRFLFVLFFIAINVCYIFSKDQDWGDLNNGYYRNFIVWSECSNPDVIRVGNNFYMITSTLHLSPNIGIYKSKDAVNWEIIGHVVPDITDFSPKYGHDRMEGEGAGSWATALRFHDNKYWMYVLDPTEGLYMSTAQHPEGPWDKLYCVSKEIVGHDDGCPFWDDKGNAYFICADFRRKIYDIKIFRMSDDGKKLLDSGTVIHQGRIAEAVKAYYRNGYYYFMHVETVNGINRQQWMMRSRNIYGPYEHKLLLSGQGHGKYDPITQGTLFDLPNGNWAYIGQSNYTTIWGWPIVLAPVTWIDDWPIIGAETSGTGEIAWQYKKPIKNGKCKMPASTDEFEKKNLSPQWEFNFQPVPNSYSLTERVGYLRMYSVKPLGHEKYRSVLLQRIIGKHGDIEVRADLRGMTGNSCGGMCVYGKEKLRFFVQKEHGKMYVRCKIDGQQNYCYSKVLPNDVDYIYFRIYHDDVQIKLSYRYNEKTVVSIPIDYRLSRWSWLGARFGVHTWTSDDKMEGYIDFDYFRYKN